MFSGEELYGKFLDLYANHTVYNNLKLVKRLGYLQYLDVLMTLDKGLHVELEKKIRLSKDYEAYVHANSPYTATHHLHIGIFEVYTHTWYLSCVAHNL